MAKFRIELSNGRTFEVEGPANASESDLLGVVASQIPEGELQTLQTKNDTFGEFLRTRALEPREGESEEERAVRLGGQITSPEIGTTEGVLRSGFQGLSFAGGDEAVGSMRAAAKKFLEGDERPFAEIQEEETERQRQLLDAFQKQQSTTAAVSEFVGAVLPAFAFPGAFVGNLGLQTVKSAGVGALLGAGQGFGAGEDTLENRLANAAVTGAFGAAGGAAAPVVGRGVQRLAESRPGLGPLLQRLGISPGTSQLTRQAGMGRQAFDIASEAVGADDIARTGQLSPNQMLAEAGDTATGMLDFLGQRPGPTQRVVREAVEGRVQDATGRVTGVLDDVLGAPQGLGTTSRQIAQQTAQVREDAYTAAYSQIIDYAGDAGQRIRDVVRRVPDRIQNEAIEQANEMAQLQGIDMPPIISLTDDLSVMQLDFLKRALNEVAEGETTNIGRMTGRGRAVSNAARDLRNAVTEAVPEYRAALQLGSDNITRQNALELGSELLSGRVKREAVNDFVERAKVNGVLPADVAEAVQAGVRQQIDDIMANVARTATDDDTASREAMKAIRDFSSRANREKLTAVLGEDGANRLFGEIDEAATAFNLRATQAQNAKTAARLMAEKRLEPDQGVIRTMLSENFMRTPGKALAAVTGQTPAAQRAVADNVLLEVAEALTGVRGQDALDLAAILQQADIPVEQAAALRGIVEKLGRGAAGAGSPGAAALIAGQ